MPHCCAFAIAVRHYLYAVDLSCEPLQHYHMIHVKKAGPPEAALIADLSRSTFHDTFAPVNTKENMDKFMREKFSSQMLIDEVSEPGNHFFIAWEGTTPVGYSRVRENNNPPGLEGRETIEIARIYAIREAIGKGVGKELMQAAIDLGRSLGKEVVWLGVWEHNLPAIAFYEKWGFERFSDHEFILGDDVQTDWLLRRNL
ncbi:MAG: GNAT family N-acetyltransferase [Chitinophagaceae bacterium]|nr:MAG: GNAT family N-acetyltransferase [Chitinophagaceae bacterium]